MARRRTKKRRSRKSSDKRIIYVTIAVIVFSAVLLALLYSGKLDDLLGIRPFKEPAAPDADTSVRFIDVGQGDCTLAVSQGVSILIDSGESSEARTVIKYIDRLGIKKLDYVIVTHPHSDHMGAMADIIDRFGAGEFIMPILPDDLTPTTASYEKLLDTLDKKDIKITPARDMKFDAGGFRVELYNPDEYDENLNNCSTVIRLRHGENSFLITGDCEKEEEDRLILKGCDLRADVLKAGHHDSATSSSAEFLAAVRPVYAVISCSEDNSYGHPAESTLKRLKAIAREVLITKDSGNIVFVSDGKGLSVYKDKD